MNRIELLASLTKGKRTVCDIGCDHAYVLIDAVKNYGVMRAIACDIADGPLQMAKKNIEAAHLSDKIVIQKSNGFAEIKEDFDLAIIAGMGGSLIVDILEKGKTVLKNKPLILQPNNDRYKVRKFLSMHQYVIEEEYAIFDQNKYYEIIVASKGFRAYDEFDLKYGPILRRNKNDVFISHYKDVIKQYNIFLDKIKDEKLKEIKKQEIKEIEDILGE